MYRERDLGVVAVAALGAGFLVGASQQQPSIVVKPGDGITIVRRLELPRPQDWGDAWRLAVPLAPQLIPVLQTDTAPPEPPLPMPPPEPEQRERAMVQQQSERPHDICYPGRRDNFWYRGALHWRCRYGR
jgi:hypothetical protein